MSAADVFHAHLDACTRCRTKPFDLCGEGARLLVATAQPAPSEYSLPAAVTTIAAQQLFRDVTGGC